MSLQLCLMFLNFSGTMILYRFPSFNFSKLSAIASDVLPFKIGIQIHPWHDVIALIDDRLLLSGFRITPDMSRLIGKGFAFFSSLIPAPNSLHCFGSELVHFRSGQPLHFLSLIIRFPELLFLRLFLLTTEFQLGHRCTIFSLAVIKTPLQF